MEFPEFLCNPRRKSLHNSTKKTKIKYLFMHVRLEDNQCERNLVKNSVKRKSKSVNVSYLGFFFVIFFSSEGGGGGVN